MLAHTVRRLELGAAVLAVEIAELVVNELDSLKFYTDSKVALGYIYNETRRFYVYVRNKVEWIRKSTCPETVALCPHQSEPCRCCHQANIFSLNLAYWSRFPGIFCENRQS